MKDFCLKDKIVRKYPHINYVRKMLLVEDVREFIKIIEQKVLTNWKGQNEFIDWLKNRTGDLE